MTATHIVAQADRCSYPKWLPPIVAIVLTLGSIALRGAELRVSATHISAGLGQSGVKTSLEVGNSRVAQATAGRLLHYVNDSREPRELDIRAHFQPDSHTLVVEISNLAARQVQLVRPRETLLMQNGEWAGWRVSVSAGGVAYLPVPLPGPSIPASRKDIITLDLNESIHIKAALANWRKSVPGVPLMNGTSLMQETSKVVAQIAWSSPPAYLQVDNVAGPAAASASR